MHVHTKVPLALPPRESGKEGVRHKSERNEFDDYICVFIILLSIRRTHQRTPLLYRVSPLPPFPPLDDEKK